MPLPSALIVQLGQASLTFLLTLFKIVYLSIFPPDLRLYKGRVLFVCLLVFAPFSLFLHKVRWLNCPAGLQDTRGNVLLPPVTQVLRH